MLSRTLGLWSLAAIAAIALTNCALAQQAPPHAIAQDELWISLLHHEKSFGTHLDAATTYNGTYGNALLRKHVAALGILPTEFPLVRASAETLCAAIDGIQEATFAQATTQRALVVAQAKEHIQSALSARSWMRFQAYFNGQLYVKGGPR
jgi:hypothetical protein